MQFFRWWDNAKKRNTLLAAIAFIVEFKGIAEFIYNTIGYAHEKTSYMHWQDILQIAKNAFKDDNLLDFISRVALFFMFVMLSKSIDKTKREVVADQKLLTQLFALRLRECGQK